MNAALQVPNSATAPDSENKTSVRHLFDGKKCPVSKCDIVKKGFDHEADVE